MKHKKFKNPKFLSQKKNKIKSFEKIKDEHQNIKNIKRKKNDNIEKKKKKQMMSTKKYIQKIQK